MYHGFLRKKSQRSRFFRAGLPEYHLNQRKKGVSPTWIYGIANNTRLAKKRREKKKEREEVGKPATLKNLSNIISRPGGCLQRNISMETGTALLPATTKDANRRSKRHFSFPSRGLDPPPPPFFFFFFFSLSNSFLFSLIFDRSQLFLSASADAARLGKLTPR